MLSQNEWEKLNQMISQMSRIKDIDRFRREFLNLLGRMIDFDLADFCFNEAHGRGKIRLVNPVVVSRFSNQFNEKFMQEYERFYEQVDYVRWIFSSHESIVYRESDLINTEMRQKSVFYLDYLKPAGLVNVAGISITGQGNCIGAVTLYRTERYGDFSDRDLYLLRQLLPHLQNKLSEESVAADFLKKRREGTSRILMQEYQLTGREIEILRLLCDGKRNGEISEALSISVNTVKKHLSNMFGKLNVGSRTQLIRFLLTVDQDIFEKE